MERGIPVSLNAVSKEMLFQEGLLFCELLHSLLVISHEVRRPGPHTKLHDTHFNYDNPYVRYHTIWNAHMGPTYGHHST